MKKIIFALGITALLGAGCNSTKVADDGTVNFTLDGQEYQVGHMELAIGSGNASVADMSAENSVKVAAGQSKYSFTLWPTKPVRDERGKHILDDNKPADYYPYLGLYWYDTTADPISYLSSGKIDSAKNKSMETTYFNVEVSDKTKLGGLSFDPNDSGRKDGFWIQVSNISNGRASGSFGGSISEDGRSAVHYITNGTFDVPVLKLYSN